MGCMVEPLGSSADDHLFSTTEIAALLSMLEARGGKDDAILRAASIPSEALDDTSARISPRQQDRFQKAALEVTGDGAILVRLARTLHPTAYGLAGYALLSSATGLEFFRVAETLAPLLNLKFSLDIEVDGNVAHLKLVDRFAVGELLCRSSAALELAKIVVLFRDVLGEDFKPTYASCYCSGASERDELSRLMGIQVLQSEWEISIGFDARLLRSPLPQAHAKTHAICMAACSEQFVCLSGRHDVAHRVKKLISNSKDGVPSLPEVASTLCMSQRTLRRRLESQGSSYNQLLEEVRKELAIRYLETTNYTTEAIAEMLGYSDAANFRHAFKRWTGVPPRHYCVSRGKTRETLNKPPQNSATNGN